MLLAISAFSQDPTNIEAAEYDPVNNRYFVSNGNRILVTTDGGESWDYFGNEGATHGMEVMGDHLYVIEGGTIRVLNLNDGSQVSSLNVSVAQFMNGMANNGSDKIWVSDFAGQRIYEIDASDPANITSTTVVSNVGATPNGLTYDADNNRVIIVTWGTNAEILSMDITDYSLATVLLSSGLGNLDGVDNDSEGNFYVSSWSPDRITRYSNDFSESTAVVTSGLDAPADISYAQATDSLAVANSFSDEVTFHYFGDGNPVNITNANQLLYSLNIFPNPIGKELKYAFKGKEDAYSWFIVNLAGQSILSGKNKNTSDDFSIIDASRLPAGIYMLQVKQDEIIQTVRFIKE